ncbi:unnamed protein product [Durusdinium trenchii]|uniref:Chloroplastic (Maize PPR4 homolog) (AtPPR4) n=2 Tax=Durusdinium trenchii TaxID=1381693 RepID=A0ABP0NEX9_9DINO
MTLPTYTIAMKLLGKLGRQDEVERLWGQLVERDIVSHPQASGRIDAAADSGDIQAAARVLRYLREKGLQADGVHFNSAINACANSQDSNRAAAAQGFLDEMLAARLKPDIVTYANLLRAFRQEPRQRLLNLLVEMKKDKVKANKVFAETFLFVFLQEPEKGSWTQISVMASDLRKRPVADLQAAKDILDEFKRTNVEFSKFCKRIDGVIQSLLEEARRVTGKIVA